MVLYRYRNFHCIHKTDDITEDVETRLDTSNYELKRPLLNGKSKKVVGLMKDELGRKILTKICWTKSKNL